MIRRDDTGAMAESNFEAWRHRLRLMCGRFYSDGIEPDSFAGWVRPVSAGGFTVLNVGSNSLQLERTYRDVRLDSADHYFAILVAQGQLVASQNDQTIKLSVGDVALVDASRPVTYSEGNGKLWNTISLSLPRQSLISLLGFEPEGGMFRRNGTPAGRLLFDLIQTFTSGEEQANAPADSYMRLAAYDLVGALFAPPEPSPASRHSDTLFRRIRRIVREGFADPDFGPSVVASETGISLRYLQKILTERGSTCSELIYAFRLEHAASLVRRRASLGTSQPLSDIAYACGFRDYAHFARKFRRRFGHAPGAHPQEPQR